MISKFKFLESFKTFIKPFDIISQEPKLKLNSANRNHTVWGGLLCITIYLFVILAILIFGQEIVIKVNPTLVYSTLLTDSNDFIQIDDDNFFFFISIKDKLGKYIKPNDGYFNINMYLLNSSRINSTLDDELSNENVNLVKTPILIKACKNFSNFKHNALSIDSSNWLCIGGNNNNNSETNNTLFLKGGSSFTNIQQLKVEVSKCDDFGNINNNTNCKSKIEIENILNGAILSIKYIDSIFDFRNFFNSNTQLISEENFYLFPNWTKSVVYELKKIDINSDKGAIIEEIKVETIFRKNSIIEFISSINLSCTEKWSELQYIFTNSNIAFINK